MPTIPEKSTAWLTVICKNRNGANVAPNTLKYRIDTNLGHSIVDWTTISNPSATQEITLTPEINTFILPEGFELQKNIVTVTSVYGAGEERNGQYEYSIENMSNI